MAAPAFAGPDTRWISLAAHRAWLAREADDLLRFFEAESLDPRGGFFTLDASGRPLPDETRELHVTTRMVHCFSLAARHGRPGAQDIVDHGMRFLWERHRDASNGGYYWSIGPDGPVDAAKQAYGHAFVLLAAASALRAGHPDADRLLGDVTEMILTHFWEEDRGASAEAFAADWSPLGAYRGQNANMHLTEALMAAFEATGRPDYLAMAERIAGLIVNRHARENGWRVPEHFTADWRVDRDYAGDPIFRPYGTTPGHALEWARLLVELFEHGKRRLGWLPDAAIALFARAVADGWNEAQGGVVYTLDHDGRPHVETRLWWPVCEGIAAAAALGALTGDPLYEEWYRRLWNFAAAHLIDRCNGGWHPQLGADGQPAAEPFAGKPDIYHALQACLLPLGPTSAGASASPSSPQGLQA